jgi:hypothetical protein
MDLFQQATALMEKIVNETKDIRSGILPSVYELTALQAELTDLFYRMGEEEARLFNAKERAILDRRCAAARHHLAGRRERGLTQGDAKEEALELARTEHEAEINQESLFEHFRILRNSLDRAFSFLAQTISTLKNLESRTTS